MANIEKLTDDALDAVSGGAFNYFSRNGVNYCYVDDIGSFYASADAFGKVAAYSSDITKTAQEVVDWALANGYLSTTPIQ